MRQKAATAAPKSAASESAESKSESKPAVSKAAASKPAGSKPAAPKSAGPKSVGPKSVGPKPTSSRRRDSDPMAWLAADDATFAEHVRRLGTAKGHAARDRLLRNGLAQEFAARLLSAASGETARQV